MPLSNAEKQARWRKRNVIVLTAGPFEIVQRLVAMEDQVTLRLIVALLNKHLNPGKDRCRFVKDDGGRSRSGIVGGSEGDDTRDCAARAIAIATERSYREVHDALTAATVRHVAMAKEGWGKAARSKGRVSLRLLHRDHGVSREILAPIWSRSAGNIPRPGSYHGTKGSTCVPTSAARTADRGSAPARLHRHRRRHPRHARLQRCRPSPHPGLLVGDLRC